MLNPFPPIRIANYICYCLSSLGTLVLLICIVWMKKFGAVRYPLLFFLALAEFLLSTNVVITYSIFTNYILSNRKSSVSMPPYGATTPLCTFSGYIMQATSVAVDYYIFVLAIYSFSVVRRKNLLSGGKGWWEKWDWIVHLAVWTLAIGTAVLADRLEGFVSNETWCWYVMFDFSYTFRSFLSSALIRLALACLNR
ncbi:hypothetical protein BKA69DRAFT_1096138 [Paraphysoderma sedebokerense]|nr:hypothetical protein BKA69DRAFT_1096138 [Paraphysoderma sedebokerense]